jgi:hypothetical protein
VYSFLGIIIGAYMIGLACGSLAGNYCVEQRKEAHRTIRYFVVIQSGIVVLPLILLAAAHWFSGESPSSFTIKSVLLLCMLTAGTLGGAQFILANTLYLAQQKNGVQKAKLGILYGVDLFGSSLGAFMISAFSIPVWGISSTLVFLFCLNLACLLMLFMYRRKTT